MSHGVLNASSVLQDENTQNKERLLIGYKINDRLLTRC